MSSSPKSADRFILLLLAAWIVVCAGLSVVAPILPRAKDFRWWASAYQYLTVTTEQYLAVNR